MADPTKVGQVLLDDNGKPVDVGNYAHINATGTNLIKTGAGFLYAIVINTAVANSVIEYDDTSTAARNATAAMGIITMPGTTPPVQLRVNAAFTNGLCITTATAASDITVIYR